MASERDATAVVDSSPCALALAGELIVEVGSLGEFAAADAGPLRISVRRYGADDRVLAMITRHSTVPSIRVRRG